MDQGDSGIEFQTFKTIAIVIAAVILFCFIAPFIVRCAQMVDESVENTAATTKINRLPAYDPEAVFGDTHTTTTTSRTATSTTNTRRPTTNAGATTNAQRERLQRLPSVTTSAMLVTDVVQVTAPSSLYDTTTTDVILAQIDPTASTDIKIQIEC